jgi:RNA polymerase sigma factor (TIGR02999 family)
MGPEVSGDSVDRLETKPSTTSVTRLLDELQAGRRAALNELFPLVYDELRVLAHRHRRRWHGDETLGTTALIHEAYLKLVGQQRIRAEGRAHFLAVASRAMRHILSNHARDRVAEKRGGAFQQLPFDERKLTPGPAVLSPEQADDVVALHEALRVLEQIDPRQGQVVECRFFGGMSVDETATALGISARTVKRDWAVAQAWLHREMDVLNE